MINLCLSLKDTCTLSTADSLLAELISKAKKVNADGTESFIKYEIP